MAGRWSFWWCAALLLLIACSGKKRPFADGPVAQVPGGDASAGPIGTSGEGAGKERAPDRALELPRGAALGVACARDLECTSGFCVDGVCCDSRCGDVCATCAADGGAGTCSAASTDSACGAFVCASGTECRGYDQTQLEQNCAAFAQCKAGIECAALDQPDGTACQAGAGACNGFGECVVPGKALLGASCAADADCGEGHCVAGPGGASICCDSACDGLCQQCSAAGRCDAAPAQDARCAVVDCPDDNVCRDYPDSLRDGLCRSFGQCKTAIDCPSNALRVDSACECSAEGVCSLARGQTCATAAECGAAACAPAIGGGTVCCAAGCGPGLSCSRDGSRCVECDGNSVLCSGNDELRCVSDVLTTTPCANGCTPDVGCNELAPVGFLCDAAQCQPGAVCQLDVTGANRCCSRDCALEGKVCADNGGCVCPEGVGQGVDQSCLLQLGDPCGPGAAACEAGLTCVDGVCCAEACAGSCESCNVPGSVGQCTFSPAAGGCALGQECVGRGECRSANGASCAGVDGSCVSNNCEPQLGGNGASICCGQACGAPRTFCSRDGSRCVQCEGNADCPNGCQNDVCLPLRGLGELCDVASQCGSGICTRLNGTNTSRCCGQCQGGQVCNAAGACECPPNQVLVAGQCRKVTGQTCASGVECQTGNCESAVDGQSRCCAQDCGDPTARRCAQDGSACIDQRGGVGTACTSGANCQNGNCVDGVCCGEPCDGACERCNAPGQAGLCTADTLGTPCGGGLECFGQGLCRAAIGGDCSTTVCGEGVCVETTSGGPRVCCATDCLAQPFCNGAGTACVECGGDGDCSAGESCSNGSCRGGDGSVCSVDSDCGPGSTCVLHHADGDSDGFAVVGALTQRFCVVGNTGVSGFTRQQPGGVVATDCLEGNGDVHPGQRLEFTEGVPANPNGAFDYDCNGVEESATPNLNRLLDCADESRGACETRGGWSTPGGDVAPFVPACGAIGALGGCSTNQAGACTNPGGGSTPRSCH